MTRSTNKYAARKTVVGEFTFDSKAEARRYGDLLLLQRAGVITGLELQVPFILAPRVHFEGVKRAKPALRYVADFCYVEGGVRVVEDLKSEITRKLPVYLIKKHLMLSVLGLQIREVTA